MVKYSVIVPTYNRVDLLAKCLQSIVNNTAPSSVEVIVVCNGCSDGSVDVVKEYIEAGYPFKLIYTPEPVGYARAINMGLMYAEGEYIILLNNDAVLLSNDWLRVLEEPFYKNPKTGITGPSLGWWNGRPTAIFFCVMIKKELFNQIGYLDPLYLIGGGEDTDFCLRAQAAGWEIEVVPYGAGPLKTFTEQPGMGFGHFPIYHPYSTTRSTIPGIEETLKKNHELLIQKWGPP